MTHIIVVRHDHVPGISPERFRGRTELELTELGVAQAHATAGYVARQWRPTAAYTSPMGRCVSTGRQIAGACGVPARVLPQLNDLDYGAWRGKTHDEARQAWPDEYRLWRRSPQLARFPDGESLQDLPTRTADGLRFALNHHTGDTIVFVGHNSSNRTLLLQILALPLSAFGT